MRVVSGMHAEATHKNAPVKVNKSSRTSLGAVTIADVIKRYQRFVARSKKVERDSYGSCDAIVTSRNPVLELENSPCMPHIIVERV